MIRHDTYKSSQKPAFHILICLIQIWDKTDDASFMIPPKGKTLEIAEVESIEVTDSYKQLINKARVRFPRGTVIRKTSETVEGVLEDAKNIVADIDDRGVLLTTRKGYSTVAGTADFSVGKRIRIYLGYTTDPKIATLPKFDPKRGSIFTNEELYKTYFDAIKGSGPIFDGYITRCSIDTPIDIECENLASVLKQFNAPNIPKPKGMTVNKLLAEDGEYKALKDTGFKLYPETKTCSIEIGNVVFNDDLTLADVLNTWSKHHLYSYVWVDYNQEPPQPYIVVGRSYFTNCGNESILKQREKQGLASEYPIYFDYNVANNGLSLTESNKDYLCIQGSCFDKNNNVYKVTLRKNPEWKEGDPVDNKWQLIQEINITKKMRRMGITTITKGKNKVDLSRYNVVPYVSAKIGCTQDELVEEMIKYYESYHVNGITGTLTLFGDLQLRSGCKVHLYDSYFPAKNGLYFVDEVHTTFGTDGFRQTIKLPYLIALDNELSK